MLRIDDIPQQVADDIHAFGVILRETVEIFAYLWYNEAKKGGGILQEIKTKALALIDKYKERLEAKGITVITMLWYLFFSKL